MQLQDIIQQNLVKPLDFLTEDPELCRQIQSRLKDLGLLSPEGIGGIAERKAYYQKACQVIPG